MIRLTLICDDCGLDRMAEAFSIDDLNLDIVPEDWVETPAGKIYCADCKTKHAQELVEAPEADPVPLHGQIYPPEPISEGSDLDKEVL